ncbi:MAG: metallophosphoesterase [Clostridia bacterium]|nr:metallophosphoesterase [Clostridia bacterium]
MKKHRIITLLIILFIVYILAGLIGPLTVRHYRVKTDKVSGRVTFAVISDLHDTAYGEKQKRLIKKIDAAAPDAVLMTGDILDENSENVSSRALISELVKRYPVYAVTGNHECFTKAVKKEAIRAYEEMGVTLLCASCADFTVRGQNVCIIGIDDPVNGKSIETQLKSVKPLMSDTALNLLLSHRPEENEFSAYVREGYDLVLSGHMHGGQWRFPPFVNGLIAPDRSLFPDHAGGRYEKDGTVVIVSRGLAKNTSVPRFFNAPELVIVDLIPE